MYFDISSFKMYLGSLGYGLNILGLHQTLQVILHNLLEIVLQFVTPEMGNNILREREVKMPGRNRSGG